MGTGASKKERRIATAVMRDDPAALPVGLVAGDLDRLLRQACAVGSLRTARFLIAEGADVASANEADGTTALHVVARACGWFSARFSTIYI
jgi:ankyrin repeat protein